jgi:hypothetical protein
MKSLRYLYKLKTDIRGGQHVTEVRRYPPYEVGIRK